MSTCLTGLPRKTDRIASRISIVVFALISIPISRSHIPLSIQDRWPQLVGAMRLLLRPRSPETKLNSPSGGGSPVRAWSCGKELRGPAPRYTRAPRRATDNKRGFEFNYRCRGVGILQAF